MGRGGHGVIWRGGRGHYVFSGLHGTLRLWQMAPWVPSVRGQSPALAHAYLDPIGSRVVNFTLRMIMVDRKAAISLLLVMSLSSWKDW